MRERFIDVLAVVHNKKGDIELRKGVIPLSIRRELVNAPIGVALNFPIHLEGLVAGETIPIIDLLENLTHYHWDMFRIMN